MAAAATPGVAEQTPGAAPQRAVPFDLSQAPNIEGFNPLPKVKDETFKEKFARKTKENPFVPIGELHKRRKALHRKVTTAVCYVLYFTQLCYRLNIKHKGLGEWWARHQLITQQRCVARST